MVKIERRMHKLVRDRNFWFPSPEQAREISKSLRPNDVVRFFCVAPALDTVPHLVDHHKMRTVWINLSAGPDTILSGMKRKSCRYEIRRAEKMLSRIAIEVGTEKANHDFLAVYNDFTQAKGLPPLSTRWMEEHSAHCETFALYFDGETLCSHLLLRDPQAGIVRLLYSGSRRLQSPEHAAACGALNRYLHWQEMLRYHMQGFMTFDFGGVGQPESIARFKLSFGGTVLIQHFYLLSGMQWAAKFGKLVSERILRRRAFPVFQEKLDS